MIQCCCLCFFIFQCFEQFYLNGDSSICGAVVVCLRRGTTSGSQENADQEAKVQSQATDNQLEEDPYMTEKEKVELEQKRIHAQRKAAAQALKETERNEAELARLCQAANTSE